MQDVWAIIRRGKSAIKQKKDMQSIEEINKVMKVKIADMNCDIEDPEDIQRQIDEKHSNLMNVDTK